MVPRRDLLRWAALGSLASALPTPALAADASPTPPAKFDHSALERQAAALAAAPFHAVDNSLPAPFATLQPAQYKAIRARQGAYVWPGGTHGFMLEPLHRGPIFANPVALNIVDAGKVTPLTYSPGQFDFGDLKIPDGLPDLGFSGFAIHAPDVTGVRHKIAEFQGASFFRAIAPRQHFGITARALSIRTADLRGEEFPQFRSFWIETPPPAAASLRLHALIDSPSAAAIVHITLHTGDATIIDVETVLYARAPLDHFGMGAMAGAYFYGPLAAHASDLLRPQVHQIDGLNLNTGANEWIWRPVANRKTLQVSVFADNNPQGFGLLQRDRRFGDYQDETHHDEAKPSLWIEPLGKWGDGGLELVEIPSSAEDNANIVLAFRPAATLDSGAMLRFAYRQFWCWHPPDHAPLARVTTTLGGVGSKTAWRAFIIEFQDDSFASASTASGLSARIDVNPGRLEGHSLAYEHEARKVRVQFEFNPDGADMCELRVVLVKAGHNISETWLYRWTS